MATTNLGLTQYIATDKIDFLTKYNGDMSKIDTAVGTANTNIGTLANLKTASKTSTVGAINEVYDSTNDGWISTRATLTYSSTSGQNFVCSTSIDLTPRVSVGMKIKLIQTTTKYFYVSAITSNSITLYGGTTYSVLNATISNAYFSVVEAPYGFPIATNGLGVDFIVEQGASGLFKWEKYQSGKLLVKYIKTESANNNTSAGGGYISSLQTISFPSNLFLTISGLQERSVSFLTDSGYPFFEVVIQQITTTSFTYYYESIFTITRTPTIILTFLGTWK